MKSNKFLAIVLAFAMILSSISFTVFANEDMAEEVFFEEVSEEIYEEFEENYEETEDEELVSLAAATELYVSSDYNSSTEGWGTTHFSSYAGAYEYATANARNSTIIVEKTNTISGNCMDNNHKKYSGIGIVIKNGGLMGNASSKWDMTYPYTIEPGGVLQSGRPVSAAYGNTHVKNTLTIGEEGSGTPAYVRFINRPDIPYKTMSIAVLYNGKFVANNADIEVGDLGFTGSSTINNSVITADGIVAFGKNTYFKHTLTDSTVNINGHNIMNEKTYYSTTGTLLNGLTMDGSIINVNDGDSTISAEDVTIKALTMKNGSAVVVENEANVKVEGKLSMDDSTIDAGVINVSKSGSVNAVNNAEINAEEIVLNGGKLVVDNTAELNVSAISGSGSISIVTESYTEGDSLPISADLSAFDGDIAVTTTSGEEVDVCINENGELVLGTALVTFEDANGKISKYLSFKKAVENLTDGATLTVKDGVVVDEGDIVFPANLTNITIAGESLTRAITPGAPETAAVIKNTTFKNPASAFTMNNFTVKGLVFENSNFNIEAWGAATEINNITFDGNTFKNLEKTTNQAAIHFNIAEAFAIDGFTVVNNIFDTIGNADNSAIYTTNDGNAVIENNIFTNIAFRPYIIMMINNNGTDDSLIVENNVFSNSPKGRAQALGVSSAGTDNVELAINGNIFEGITQTYAITYWNFNEDTTDINFRENYFDVAIAENASKIYYNKAASSVSDLREMTIFPYYSRLNSDNTIDYSSIITGAADAVNVQFRPFDGNADEGSLVYDIVVSGENSDVINRLNTADLTFTINNSDIAYDIIASNEEVEINKVYNPADGSEIAGRYEFHYAGKDNTKTDTATSIVIGQVKLCGFGKFIFKIANATTNLITATTVVDNIVEEFTGDNLIVNYDVDLSDDLYGDIDTEIAVPTRDLTIKVSFPNNIVAREFGYQDMRVIVSGPEGYNKTFELGDGYNGTENIPDDGCYYAVSIEDELTLNTPYTVTVEGAGYRTVKYTVNMTEDKMLNFWNNVKDNDVYVEEGLTTGTKKYAQKVTFLAGDIVKDNNINVYDLSAVVSYFGEINLAKDNKPTYAKYDLNRDGKVDSKDVAYVLVSWGN